MGERSVRYRDESFLMGFMTVLPPVRFELGLRGPAVAHLISPVLYKV